MYRKGGARVPFLLLLVVAAMVLIALGGCASIEYAGHAAYTVKAGATGGYELTVQDGKEYAGRDVVFATDGKSVSLTIKEGASLAFTGQALAVKALTVLPVSGLADLLNAVPAVPGQP
jgi:hypothetical protein